VKTRGVEVRKEGGEVSEVEPEER